MKDVKLNATLQEIGKLRDLFSEFYDEENKSKRIGKSPDPEYPTVQKYVDRLYEIGMPKGTSVKNMGIILEKNYEEAITMSGAPESAVQPNTLTPDQLKQLQEEAESKETKRKEAVEKSQTDVRTAINRQQEIYAEQIKKAAAAKKEFENQTKYAGVKEEKLAEDQQKEIDDLRQQAKANPQETVRVVSAEIKNRLGDSIPQEAADVAAFEVVSSLSLNYAPVIQAGVVEAVSKDAASKGEKEVAEWITSLSEKNQGIDLSKQIITGAFGQEFTKAVLPEVIVSNTPGPGLGPVPLSFIAQEATNALDEKIKILNEPFLQETDYANKWFGSQLALMEGDRTVTQREIYFTTFKSQGRVDWQGIGGQKSLNAISGASTLKTLGGVVQNIGEGIIQKAAVESLAETVIGTTEIAAAPETAGLSLVPLVLGFLRNFASNAQQWLKEHGLSEAVPAVLVGALFFPFFGYGGVVLGGATFAGLKGFNSSSAQRASFGRGVGSFFGSLAGATVGSIGAPILATLLGFPVVVALILFIINSGAYVVPPSLSSLASNAQNQFIDVTKTANPAGPFQNSDLPLKITYTVTISAKKTQLTGVTVTNKCSVTTKSGSQNCTAPPIVVPGGTVSVGSSFTTTYDATYNPTYKDSLVVDTVTVSANIAGQTQPQIADATASIKIGNPPDVCPNGWPVDGNYIITQTPGGSYSHRGIEAMDIGMPIGTSVKSTSSGVAHVVYTGGPYRPVYVDVSSTCGGKQISVRYAHFSSVAVKDGQQISMGQLLGRSGTEGSGPHLHYEFIGLTMAPPYIPKTILRNCSSDTGKCGSIP